MVAQVAQGSVRALFLLRPIQMTWWAGLLDVHAPIHNVRSACFDDLAGRWIPNCGGEVVSQAVTVES